MRLIKAFLMSAGMFSIFPVPKNTYNKSYAPLVIPNLPVIGLLIGLTWYAVAILLTDSSVPQILQAAAITLVPYILSGFLHIDGYMDTSDAILSRRNLDERRRILKDSHIGSFAAVMLMCLFLIQFCSAYTIVTRSRYLSALIFIPTISRGVTGVALLNLKPISNTGLAADLRANTRPIHTLAVLIITAAGFIYALIFEEIIILIPLAVTLLAAVLTAIYVNRKLRGISGDLCGCIITVGEVAGLLCLALL